MNKKVINIIGTLFIFLIGFIIHNLYKWFPSVLTLILSPVSESLFEHLKMILTSYMIWIIIKYLIFKKYNIHENNFLFKELLTTIIGISLFYLVYIPIYNATGENLLVTLFIYFFSISVTEIINYFINFKKDINWLKSLSIIVIILIYTITTYLTYKPPIIDFFLDPTNNSYGINK